MLGSATAETNLQTLRLPCYLQLFGVDVGERDCGDESADAAVTVLFAAVGGRCWGKRLRRRICGRLSCGDESADGAVTMLLHESADAAVTMLFAAVGGRCWGARLRRRICGRFCYHAICS